MTSPVSYAALLEELGGGRSQAIFIDDGGGRSHTLPPEILVEEYLLYAGVVVRPPKLAVLERLHAVWLDRARGHVPTLREFHAVDLVNPNKKSAWRGISVVDRAALLDEMFEIFFRVVELVVRGAIGQEQYFDSVAKAQAENPGSAEANHSDMTRHDHGLERAFHKALALYAGATQTPTVIIQDAGRYSEQFKGQFKPEFPVWNGGVAYLPSESVPGIQLADLAAYSLFRLFAIEARRAAGKTIGPLEDTIERRGEQLAEIVRDAWSLGVAADDAIERRQESEKSP